MNTCVNECPDGYYIDLSTRVCVKLLVNFYLNWYLTNRLIIKFKNAKVSNIDPCKPKNVYKYAKMIK